MVLKGLIPSSLYIENGLTYKSVNINLENQGLVFVRGINHDTDQQRSNGSGKSSFADILEHVLYDSTSRGLDKDEIIRAGSSEGYYAKLCLKTPSGVYFIEQARKHSKHGTILRIIQEFPHGLEEVSVPKNINKTKQQMQSQILKMTKQQFHGSVYLSQEAGFPLVSGTGAEVSKYLSSTFGFDVYDDMRAKVKSQIDQLQERVAQADAYINTIKDIDTKLSEFQNIDYIVEMEKALTEYLDYGQEQISRIYEDLTSLGSKKSLAERRESIVSSIRHSLTQDELQIVLNKKQKLYGILQNQFVDLSTQYKLHVSSQKERDRLSAKEEELRLLLRDKPHFISEDLTNISLLIENHTEKLQRVSSFLEKADRVLAEKPPTPEDWEDGDVIKNHKEVLLKFDSESSALLSEASKYDSLKKALDETVCPTCGQDVPSSDSRSVLEEALSAAAKSRVRYNNLLKSKKISEKYVQGHILYTNYIASADMLKGDIEKSFTLDSSGSLEDVASLLRKSFDPKKMKQEISSASRISSVFSEISMLRSSLDSKESFDTEYTDFDSSLSSLKVKMATLQGEIDVINSDIRSLSELKTLPDVSVASVDDHIASLNYEISEFKVAYKQAQSILNKFSSDAAVIRDLTARRIKSNTYLENFKEDLRHLEWLKTLYKALAKLKSRKLHSVVENIRDVLPEYIGTMFDGEDISFEIDDDDPESVLLWASRPHPEKKGERVWLPARGLSKGERAGLRVSLLWTLKDISQPEKSVDLLILDEADDGLDEAGLAAFCSLLEKIRHQYGTVIVISQRKELTGVQFDQIWTAVKSDGVTTLNMN